MKLGDKDGIGEQAQLQHPLSLLALDQEWLLISDTYNHKLKYVHIPSKEIVTLYGQGQGFKDGDKKTAQFAEPAGLHKHEDSIFIADTNNCAIRKLHFEKGIITTLQLKNVPVVDQCSV